MEKAMEKINVHEKLALFGDRWRPRIVAGLNGQHVKLAKLEGSFVWHRHDEEDELFFVLRGKMTIELRDGRIDLEEGELCVVPRGVEHRPSADSECHVLLFEPAGTLNTGNVRDGLTVEDPERV
jgi:mannose-6-phosphate isomerase-like protein (cupin superfamily)